MHYLLIKIYFKDIKVGEMKEKIIYKIWIINSSIPRLC